MSKQNQDTITKLAIAVAQVIQIHLNRPEITIAFEQQMSPECESEDFDFQYAEAVFRWRSDGKPTAYFSTASPILLALRKELEKEFGLEIVDPKTGKKRETAMPTFRTIVDGWQTGHRAKETELDAQYDRDLSFLKKNKIPILN